MVCVLDIKNTARPPSGVFIRFLSGGYFADNKSNELPNRFSNVIPVSFSN